MVGALDTNLKFTLLGPVGARRGGAEIDLGPPQQRGVLAWLLLNAGQPVLTDSLLDQLWGHEPPRCAPAALRTYISRLRGALSSDTGCPTIESIACGYALPVEPDTVDLRQFERHVASARSRRAAGDTADASRRLYDALRLWRGPALSGVRGDFLGVERARLEQLRHTALQERIELDLHLGRQAEVVSEIASLVAADPLAEPLRELQMLALYGCGRHAEALAVFREIRQILGDSLGIRPGPRLRELHQRILCSDPNLQLADPAGATDPASTADRAGVGDLPACQPKPVSRGSAPAECQRVLGTRLRLARRRQFIGRVHERALFRAILAGTSGGIAALFLHGPGGIGKSQLLDRFAEDAQELGRTVLRVDGRTVGDSPSAFTADAAMARDRSDAVLLVDAFEHCEGLETWLRDDFLPTIAEGSIAVLAGRQPPSSAWRTAAEWLEALRVLPLGELARHEADDLLSARGVNPALRETVYTFTGGHPLALALAAEVATGEMGGNTSWLPTQDVVGPLLSQLVGVLPSTAHRTALEVCAHAHTTTEELLFAVMPTEKCAELFNWLREQPYIKSGRYGICPHDLVRNALENDLRRRNPRGYEAMHERLQAHLLDLIQNAEGRPVLRHMRALGFMQRHSGVIANFVTFQGESAVDEDSAQPCDTEAIITMVEDIEGPESAQVGAWIEVGLYSAGEGIIARLTAHADPTQTRA